MKKICGENSPVKFLKREGVSLEGSEASKRAGKGKRFEPADYISGSRSNPHSKAPDCSDEFYDDHGSGE